MGAGGGGCVNPCSKPCFEDGMCAANGTCVPGPPIVCKPVCSGSSIASQVCKPSVGVCEAVPATPCMKGLVCNAAGDACATTCSAGTTSGCIAGDYCVSAGDACAPRKDLGQGCGSSIECKSSVCDRAQNGNVCAQSVCMGDCRVVAPDGKSCVNADAGTAPKGNCPGKCAGSGECNM